jgi:predicted nucleotidyltransferase
MLPEFNSDGNLPEDIHLATVEEVFLHFVTPSARRQWLGEQLRSLLALAKSTGQLARVFLWGSFVTSKEVPNDIDIDVLLVMAADFVLEALPAHCQVLFDHVQARLSFHTDVFWTKASIDAEVLQLWLDTYQTDKDFRRRGIVEVTVS